MSRKKSLLDKINFNTSGGRIKSIRLSSGLNQYKFAKLLGIKQGTLSDIENGKRKPSERILIVIEYRFSISSDQILTGEGFCLNKVRYRSTKEELGPSTVYEPIKEVSTPTDPIEQILKGFTQLFKEQKKELEKLSSICKDLQEEVSSLKEKLRKRTPGKAGNQEDITKQSAT